MILPDVNVLIYAFRRDLPQHAVCRAWLAGVVMSDARFGLSPLVLGAVVRVTTNPRVYRMPSTIEEAFGYCENLLGQPHCQIVEPGERHWDIFKRLCIETEREDPVLPMPGSQRSPSNGVASGSRSIAIMQGSRG
jgi:uncharacterized protein